VLSIIFSGELKWWTVILILRQYQNDQSAARCCAELNGVPNGKCSWSETNEVMTNVVTVELQRWNREIHTHTHTQ